MLNILRSRSLPNTSFYEPSQVLSALNQTFQRNGNDELYDDKYFTIWYGVYHPPSGKLVYASAGHPPAILLSRSPTGQIQSQLLKTPSLPIGLFPEAEYFSASTDIASKSQLYVFSDGVYEIQQENGTVWGLDSFTHLLTDYGLDLPEVLTHLLNRIQTLSLQEILDDDLSILQLSFG